MLDLDKRYNLIRQVSLKLEDGDRDFNKLLNFINDLIEEHEEYIRDNELLNDALNYTSQKLQDLTGNKWQDIASYLIKKAESEN